MGDSSGTNVIFWFRQDLRISDNPAFSKACQRGSIIPIYILDDVNSGIHKLGGASRWWLNSALKDLNESLGGFLRFYKGDALTLVPKLAQAYNAQGVFWSRCYEPWRINRDTKIKQQLTDSGIEVLTCNGSLLWEPWRVLKKNGEPYRIYTPYYRRGCLSMPPP
ncbi:MAG: deoxyribodipyrimidine photolyase, partial [Porticoccaceae bacterium]|nr:deoxyribodipyrimidine photolyase [Porticoccaceae bacterium]